MRDELLSPSQSIEDGEDNSEKEEIMETQQLSEDVIEDVEENAAEAGISIDESS